ncbi:hypothetical protein AALO_G00304130 [Alosa alosa]|uniref:Uncharacterized protein n=1 Tax=Alosa alosa TaxID=278164 RepID=A0AAV6FF33_9TELE|nr:hypothetical protein AALO_G00304130 [Alosa alosa]
MPSPTLISARMPSQMSVQGGEVGLDERRSDRASGAAGRRSLHGEPLLRAHGGAGRVRAAAGAAAGGRRGGQAAGHQHHVSAGPPHHRTPLL